MSRPALACRSVTARYARGAAPALFDLSARVERGERVAVLGLNGSGKTTLLMAAAGLVPFEGEIDVGGTPVSRSNLDEVREQIGVLFSVPEDQLLFPTPVEDVAFGILQRGAAPAHARSAAVQALDSFGVGAVADASVYELSHGQKLRVALAGALVTNPSLLLLDEPSAGLDPPARRALCRRLLGLDTAMLVATHDLGFAAALCTRFLLLDEGRLVFDGPRLGPIRRRWRGLAPTASATPGLSAD